MAIASGSYPFRRWYQKRFSSMAAPRDGMLTRDVLDPDWTPELSSDSLSTRTVVRSLARTVAMVFLLFAVYRQPKERITEGCQTRGSLGSSCSNCLSTAILTRCKGLPLLKGRAYQRGVEIDRRLARKEKLPTGSMDMASMAAMITYPFSISHGLQVGGST